MKRTITVVLAAAFLGFLAAPAVHADVKTIKGELVEVGCALKKGDGGKGEAHAGCAAACAKKGLPMGILADDGIYTITGDYTKDNNKMLLEYIAKMVEGKGDVTEKDGKKMIALTALQAAK